MALHFPTRLKFHWRTDPWTPQLLSLQVTAASAWPKYRARLATAAETGDERSFVAGLTRPSTGRSKPPDDSHARRAPGHHGQRR